MMRVRVGACAQFCALRRVDLLEGLALHPAPGVGSKWSLKSLKAHVEKERGPEAWRRVWRQVPLVLVA